MSAIAATAAATSAEDADLVAEVRAGDDSAYEELYRRYQRRVFAFVYRRVRDEARAEDLTQEVFFSALRRLRETEAEVAFRPWVFEIARNATIDHFRRQSRAQEVSVDSLEEHVSGDGLQLVARTAPDHAFMARQRFDALRGAFAELSPTHERILVLRELEGLSYREIAEQMELTRPGVESTLFRARRRLEHEFSELESGHRCVSVRAAMARIAQGTGIRGDRGRAGRHVRRCSACAAAARELGVENEIGFSRTRAAAVAALPFDLVRRLLAQLGGTDGVLGAVGAKGAAVAAAVAVAGGSAGVAGFYAFEEERPRPPASPSAERPPPPPVADSRATTSGPAAPATPGPERSAELGSRSLGPALGEAGEALSGPPPERSADPSPGSASAPSKPAAAGAPHRTGAAAGGSAGGLTDAGVESPQAPEVDAAPPGLDATEGAPTAGQGLPESPEVPAPRTSVPPPPAPPAP